ncbi:pentapeptide repeat-containing protein [Streptomyces sp. NPDC050703]|uniref:pentapeptide repeat-containing protein n=1 Tax=Streptomyces sp. NPDC050703 TaxID=3157218 RepID=UPI003449B0BD
MRRSVVWGLVLASAGVLVVVVSVIFLVPRLLYPPLSEADLRGVRSAQARIELRQAQYRLANDARTAMLQSCVGLVVVIGAAATWRQVHVSRESQLTERFTRAVDQIGSSDVNVRIGGIYALEHIAKNSHADRDPIQFLLGAFVRGRLTWLVGSADGPEHPTPSVDDRLPVMNVRAPDVQAAMWVLERRIRTPDDPALYLSRVDLRGISLRGARLGRTLFRHSNLARAALTGARLDRSDFTDADLRGALLDGASLKGANLSRAHLQGAGLRRADVRGANLRGADLSGTVLDEALLTGAHADATTVWPAGLSAAARRERGILDAGPGP